MSAAIFTGGESDGNIRGWVIFAGILTLVAGIAAIIYNGTATVASVVVFGALLLISGAAETVNAFQLRYWSGFFLFLLDGLIRATVGTLLILYPNAGAQALTLVLCFFFIAGGLFKTFASISLQFPTWGWSVASGVISVVLGVMLAMQWPTSSTWFIGFAVGLDLVIYGWALLMLASALKKVTTALA